MFFFFNILVKGLNNYSESNALAIFIPFGLNTLWSSGGARLKNWKKGRISGKSWGEPLGFFGSGKMSYYIQSLKLCPRSWWVLIVSVTYPFVCGMKITLALCAFGHLVLPQVCRLLSYSSTGPFSYVTYAISKERWTLSMHLFPSLSPPFKEVEVSSTFI